DLLVGVDAPLPYPGRVQLLHNFFYCMDADTEGHPFINRAFSSVGPLYNSCDRFTYFSRRSPHHPDRNRHSAYLSRRLRARLERKQKKNWYPELDKNLQFIPIDWLSGHPANPAMQ